MPDRVVSGQIESLAGLFTALGVAVSFSQSRLFVFIVLVSYSSSTKASRIGVLDAKCFFPSLPWRQTLGLHGSSFCLRLRWWCWFPNRDRGADLMRLVLKHLSVIASSTRGDKAHES